MLKLKLVTLLFCGFILTTCQKKEDTQLWIVENNSSSEIYVQFNFIGGSTDTDTIQSGMDKSIYYNQGGVGEDLSNPVEFMVVSIFNAQDTLVKDENLESNWTLDKEEISKRPYTYSYTYQFSVTDLDF